MALPRMKIEDDSRFAAAVAAHVPRLRAFVRRQIADVDDVDDIVQDTLLELTSAYRLAEPIEHLAAWLFRVARNRVIDRFRTRSRHAVPLEPSALDDLDSASVLDGWLEPNGFAPESAHVREAFVDELLAALDELPAAQRDIFVAHELDGRSFKDLAAESGVAINTLLGRKRTAVLHLRRRLEDIRSEFDI